MADPWAKVVQGVADGTPLPVTGGGAGGEVAVYSLVASRPVFALPVDQAGNKVDPAGSDSYQVVLLGGTVLSASFQSALLRAGSAPGVFVWASVSVLTGTSPTWQVSIDLVDTSQDILVTPLQSAVQSAAGTVALAVRPGLANVANQQANYVLSHYWQIRLTLGGTTPMATTFMHYSLTM